MSFAYYLFCSSIFPWCENFIHFRIRQNIPLRYIVMPQKRYYEVLRVFKPCASIVQMFRQSVCFRGGWAFLCGFLRLGISIRSVWKNHMKPPSSGSGIFSFYSTCSSTIESISPSIEHHQPFAILINIICIRDAFIKLLFMQSLI